MNIKETALKVWDSNMIECPPENLTKFAEALVAELAKENEPVAWMHNKLELELVHNKVKELWRKAGTSMTADRCENYTIPLFTLPPTAEQIEQETAGAIAKHFGQQPHVEHFGDNIAEAVRSGKWREYL